MMFRSSRILSLLLVLSLLFGLSSALTGCSSSVQQNVSTTADLAVATETVPAATTTETAATASDSPAQTASAEETQAVTEETPAPEPSTEAPVTEAPTTTAPPETGTQAAIDEDGSYFSRDDVALYIHTYGRLPDNFVTKKEAQAAGWTGGSVEAYFPGCAIGGDRFGNYEGLLPKKKGRTYYECDIDTQGRRSRGAKRIIFSNDGYIYYTDDHYESFTELYKGGAS